jgi:hypothetical protein
LGRGLSHLILGGKIAKIANLGSKTAGLSSNFWENCMILKKISIGKRPFIGVCYIKAGKSCMYTCMCKKKNRVE